MTEVKAQKQAGNNQITLLLCNGAVNTIEEVVFSMDPPQDYISSTEQNPIRRSTEEYNKVQLKVSHSAVVS
jgi:3-deoxy-D-arabino-heptulosonate 7-phosphate (DAHP) synthase